MAHIGARVAQARRERGLTQAQLGTAMNFSLSLVKAVEQGWVPASHAFTTAVVRVLGVELGWLLGQDQVHRHHQDDDPTAAAELRSAIDAYDDPQLPGAAHTLVELEAIYADAEQWWQTGRYDRMSLVLPELLRHLYVHVRDAIPGSGHAEHVHALLADTYSAIQAAAGRYGCTDVVGIAVERHLVAAAASGDPLRPAVAAFRRSQLQVRWGQFDSAVGSLQRAEYSITDLSDPRAEAVRVQLQLRQALLRARQGDRDTADELVSEARARIRARQLPAHPYPSIIASGLNADMHWMAVAMEAQDGTTALTRARESPQPPCPAVRPTATATLPGGQTSHGLTCSTATGRAASMLCVAPELRPHNGCAITQEYTRPCTPSPPRTPPPPTAWPNSSPGSTDPDRQKCTTRAPLVAPPCLSLLVIMELPQLAF